MGRAADLTLEFLVHLVESDEVTLTDFERTRQADGDIWSIGLRWSGTAYDAVLDLKADQLVLEGESKRVRAEITDQGYRIGSAEPPTTEAAADLLVGTLKESADPWP